MGNLPIVSSTFTPTISGAKSAGVGTYTQQSGFYYRIGQIVFVTGSMTWTAHTGTGNMLVAGLPITVRNVARNDAEMIIRTDSIPWPAGTGVVFGEVIPGTTTAQIV